MENNSKNKIKVKIGNTETDKPDCIDLESKIFQGIHKK